MATAIETRYGPAARFAGCWRMVRLVTGPDGAALARFGGLCRFEPSAGGLACREAGVLRVAGGRFAASRATLWRFPGGDRVEVLFEDGRPFHAFSLSRPAAEHLCGADRYEVLYRFDADRWFSLWRVRGPRKDLRILTRYRRLPLGAKDGRCAFGPV